MVRLMLLILLLCASTAFALSVNLQWDANTETDLEGYKVYTQRPMVAQGFVQYTTVRGATKVTLANLSSSHKYYFSVTAFNTSGQESGYSNVVSVGAPTAQQRGKVSGSIR